MESKSTEQVNMDLPPYRAFPKLVDTRKKWTMGVSVAVFLVMIIVAGTLVGVYMTQKHTEQIWKQETSPRAASPSCPVIINIYQPNPQELETIVFQIPEIDTEKFEKFPLEELLRLFNQGFVKEKRLFDISVGPPPSPSNCELVSDYSFLRGLRKCRGSQRDKRHALGGASSTTDGESSQPEEKPTDEENEKCVAETNNLVDLVGEQVDYILSYWLLDLTSKTPDEYRKKFKKILGVLKTGGRIFLAGAFNAEYYKAKNQTLDLVSYNESFVRKVMYEEKMKVIDLKIYSENPNPKVVVYDGHYILVAEKKN